MDLFSFAADPLPRLRRPRWLARLPQVLVVLFAVACFLAHTSSWPTRDGAFIAGLQAAAVIVTMTRPVLGWWLAVLALAIGARVIGEPYPWGFYIGIPMIGVLFLLALRVRPRTVIEALGVTMLVGLACTGWDFTGKVRGSWGVFLETDIRQAAALFASAALVGALLRARRVARVELIVQTEVTAEERAKRTMLEERGRIARELHDVVAHHLSVISIQAQVAPHLVENPPEPLQQNLQSIRQNALDALTELRRVLGVLRLDDMSAQEQHHLPQPTLDRLEELVGNVRAAGVSVTTEITGEPRRLSPGVELSAYRIVQEALSNAMRHSPGSRVQVSLAYQPTTLDIGVTNSVATRSVRPTPGAGHGLLGMQERAVMLGGSITTGLTPEGGYEVTATLPIDSTGDTA